jgi:ABC-type dipeptide/oligopeptide/nickel transport system permease component
MLAYIVRRLLLMVPTLVGITLLVFMLLALSPGGIGAGLRVSGGQMEASKAALMEAYLEDRYGLDDPFIVQYGRWLGRISPIKFGIRDQVLPTGALVRYPKAIQPTPLEDSWFASMLVPADRLVQIRDEYGVRDDRVVTVRGEDSPLVAEYKAAAKSYSKTRADYLVARKELDKQLVRLAAAENWNDVVSKGSPVHARFASLEPDRSLPEWAEVKKAAAAALDAKAVAESARSREAAAFNAKPYPEDGIAIVPGVLSLAWPDLGTAFSRGRPVKDLILTALPVTLLLNAVTVPIIYLIAIPAGMLAARYRGSWFDVSSGALFVAFWSIPTVWAGVLAIGYLADKQHLGWFPVSGLHANDADGMTFLPSFVTGPDGASVFSAGYLLDTLWHLALPVACLVYTGFAVLAKQTRAAMLDNFNQDYVRTAKAKGVPGRVVLMRHVFRNSLLPLITMFVTIFPAMLAGSVIVEKIFSIPGMGSLILDAINLRDRELILANTFMIAVVNLLALLLADILYAFADPRISYD